MRYYYWLTLLWLLPVQGQETKNLLDSLDQELQRQEVYVHKKQERIDQLRRRVHRNDLKGDLISQYDTYLQLFQEYKSFKYDSAYFYIDKAKRTAASLADSSLIARAEMKEGFILLSSGLFKEAVDSLNAIDPEDLVREDRYQYHFIRARLNYDLADYNNDRRFQTSYIHKGNHAIERALTYTDSSDQRYWAADGLRRMKLQEWKAARDAFLKLITEFELSPEDYAVAASSLSYVYSQLGSSEKAVGYLATAAISDIRSATMENVALRNLAHYLYRDGRLEKAHSYVQKALKDATFYNARHRKIEISSILPIIEGAQLLRVQNKNDSLENTVLLLALLSAAILLFLFIIYKQLKEKNAARKALGLYNLRLQEMNRNLEEADAIKQDYITYFLKATSQLFSKIGHLQASTVQKIKTKQPEEVLNVLKKYSIKKERKDLFRQFDEVFLKLFPTFIEDFDSLFEQRVRKEVKEGELLSKELRIFALYRLGIQDSQQIAEFMDLSVATIYSYKARLKGQSLYRDSFEDKILQIQTLH